MNRLAGNSCLPSVTAWHPPILWPAIRSLLQRDRIRASHADVQGSETVPGDAPGDRRN